MLSLLFTFSHGGQKDDINFWFNDAWTYVNYEQQ